MTQFRNWSGSVEFSPKRIEQPSSEAELQALIAECSKSQTPVRVVGSGHSFTKVVETEGVLVSLDNLQGILGVDDKGFAEVWGGTKLWRMNELLAQKKRGPENLGDIDRQSIAGTVSTGTHGTGATLGSVATQLRELTLVTANGQLLTCSPEQNPETFKAAQVSLGSLGVISRVKLMTLPAYKMKLVARKEVLEDLLNDLPARVSGNRHMEFFTFPYSKYVQAKYSNFTDEPAQKRGFKDYFNDVVMENLAFMLLSVISRWVPGTTKAVSQICGAAIGDATKVNWAHEAYATPRMVKFQEMEFSFPREQMADVVREIREMIEKKNVRVHFPLECRFVKGDDIWLSPAYGRDSAYIAVHMYKGMEYKPYFEAVQSIFRNHQGRPHWGKMHFMTAKELRPLYPMWDRFQEVRKQLDPKGVFMSEYLKKLFVES